MDGHERFRADRRTVLGAMGAGVVASSVSSGSAAQTSARADGLEEAFRRLFAPATRAAMLADNAVVIDNDAPFPFTKGEYLEHVGFHGPLWEKREWQAYDLVARRSGDTGVVTAFLMDRGKPRNAGFRIRPTYCTAVFASADGGWQAIALHLGPLNGQLTDISPG